MQEIADFVDNKLRRLHGMKFNRHCICSNIIVKRKLRYELRLQPVIYFIDQHVIVTWRIIYHRTSRFIHSGECKKKIYLSISVEILNVVLPIIERTVNGLDQFNGKGFGIIPSFGVTRGGLYFSVRMKNKTE